jgi:hypothetical protein
MTRKRKPDKPHPQPLPLREGSDVLTAWAISGRRMAESHAA